MYNILKKQFESNLNVKIFEQNDNIYLYSINTDITIEDLQFINNSISKYNCCFEQYNSKMAILTQITQ